VDEAVRLFEEYNILFGGPPLHYLVADAKGRAVLVEFYRGEMHVFENTQPCHPPRTSCLLRLKIQRTVIAGVMTRSMPA